MAPLPSTDEGGSPDRRLRKRLLRLLRAIVGIGTLTFVVYRLDLSQILDFQSGIIWHKWVVAVKLFYLVMSIWAIRW